jgi:hypothetical protein
LPPDMDQSRERRAAPRRICHQPCLVRFDRRHLDGQPGSVGAQADISDLSAFGVGLLMRPAHRGHAALAVEESTASLLPSNEVPARPRLTRRRTQPSSIPPPVGPEASPDGAGSVEPLHFPKPTNKRNPTRRAK